MARRRKNEVKPSVKSSLKYVPVRKSSRQIAKKQLEEKKVNGDVQMSCSNIVDDTRIIRDNQSEGIFKKSQNSQKKYSKHKDSSNKEEITFNSSYKRDAGESDSQDGLDVLDQSDKLSPEDVRQMVVGNPNTNNECLVEPTTREVEVWPEDIIEETIICEEMEVEGDVAENSYNLAQEDNVTVEQVLLVDEPNLEGKNFVEYTVIQNEDGTQSMVVASSNTNISSSSGYHIIQDGVKSMHVTEANNTISTVYSTDSSHLNNENSKDALRNFDKVYGNKKKIILDLQNCAYKNDNKISKKIDAETEKRSIDKERIEDNCSLSKDITQENGMYTMKSHKSESKDTYSSEKYEETTKEDAFCKIDNKLATMQLNDSSKEIEKLVNDLCSVESADSPVQTCINIEKISPINEDDESSSSILDKMEQLHRQNNSEPNPDMTNVYHKSIEQGNKEQNILESDTCFEKIGCPSQSSLNSGGLQDKIGKEEKSFDHLQNTEETCVDSEPDGKIDSEDMKLSSSGDSSNDTLLSINNYKVPELDVKGMQNSTNDSDKKVEFRSRSGSTDTTGSESGSNSSGVRRSSRIRSIGLMKQRSRGRGLVTKFNTDVSKATFPQEKDKIIINSTSVSQEVKMNVDNQSEQQCDKENGSNKIPSALDSFPPLVANCNTAGYDSDSSKPVKVKSRWRRSSELEMGGSSSGFGATASTVFSYSSGFTCESISHVAAKSLSDSTMGEQGTSECGYGGSASMITSAQPATEINQDNENLLSTSFIASTITQLSKTVGTKIPLPMVLESKDREMEERLSQFEHLHENLYLTDRYTNKETKRMVCDCFLTEEEIERGELGCGEDCLNRLLMIECGPRCVVGDRCTNKRFQNCDYAKCEIFRTEKKGFGLRAAVDLDIGEFIMEYVGEVVDPKDFRRRAKEYSKDKNRHYYFMALKSDQIIDATMKGNISRFINHSCDPNAETQKWTVNGELRIGFFNKKFITAGEEITFDYHFQRYGKEAQKCFCEAPNCRGWIGDTPEEEKEKIDKKEKREKDMKKKKEEKKPTDYMEDEDLEEEIGKLCSGGLKNRAHTLTLSRLMVRSREPKHRTRLLRLIQSGEQPCRRLFLDYHGLRLIWSYVMDISANESDEAQQFRLEILKTLNTLPIPNKTMLMDSKIYSVVERWANRLHFSPNRDSPEDEQLKSKGICEDVRTNYDSNIRKNSTNLHEISDMPEGNIEHLGITEIKSENTDQSLIIDIASNLLSEWSNLKEVFRIPKKERIEQMKEHEREADRGYREELEKEEKRGTSYDRHRPDRYGRNEVDKRVDRRRGRESPEAEHNKAKDKKVEERSSLVPIPRMTKYERRQLFALKVAKEEEERQRRQQQESWQEHESRCLALGIDPHSTAMLDPQTGYPVFYNPSIGQWQHYSTQDGGEIVQQCTPVYIPGTQPLPGQATVVSQNPHMLPSAISSEISPSITTGIPSGVPPVVYSLNQTPVFNQTTTSYSLLSHCHQQYPESQLPLSNNVMSVQGVTPPMPVQYPATTSSDNASCQPPVVPEVPPIDLPPKWKTAVDARGRTYYYHVKERVSQWLPPPPDHIGVQPDSSSTSESSEESSSSNEDEEDVDDERVDQKNEDVDFENNAIESTATDSRYSGSKKVTAGTTGSVPVVASKKRRDGLVQERIISPRREEDRVDHKAYKELKEKLRRQKEKAKLKEYVEKLRKHRRSNKSKSHSRHGLSKTQSISSNLSTMSERKIKDTFRINMANVMVHFLNPYRKNDCKQGRITNTEDFKHLARKLTHFVLAKELKHCKSVDELQCNENVKHKAKDFVRKYMSKFGAVYQKGTDED